MTSIDYPSVVASRRTTHELPNGLRVVVEEDPHTSAVAINLWYGVGSRHEVVGRTGLAHLFEHLMFQGSAQVASGEHFALLDALGATLNATTAFDRTNYFETVPPEALELALWLEADRMGGLLEALDQRSLDNQRDVVRNERRQRYDNRPYGTAMELLFAATFPEGHQYHHTPIGSMADLHEASLADVRAFFGTHYYPGNAVLSIVGDVRADETLSLVERYFGGIGTGTPAPVREPQTVPPPLAGPRLHIDDEPVPASAVQLMWPIPADGTMECDQVDLAARVLGGTMSSRLHAELVRGRDLAQRASAGVFRLIGGNSVAMVDVLGADGVDSDKLLEATRDAIRGCLGDGPTVRELAAARAQAEADHLEQTQDLAGRADSLSHGMCLFSEPGHDEATVAALDDLDQEQVGAAARAWLRPESATTLTYQPMSGKTAKEAS
ncbi:M16 family metallopeptidase [Streptomyces sp. NPDC091217]|uniref:M16 family metallopeptidase n=1 Tax=Streptomyces sp. NPDC091217 TaxID=3365975 RepID=UPI00382B0103